MKKVLDLLEKNVQWIAMGLGGIYLLWMVWTYVINSPVKVTGVGPAPLSPGEVDQYIADNIGDKLRREMDGAGTVAFSSPNFSGMLADVITPKPVPNFLVEIFPSPVAPAVPLTGEVVGSTRTGAIVANPVTQLPKLPAAMNIKEISGRTNVLMPAAAAPGAPPQPLPPPPQPGQPANGTDIAWDTVMFHIPVAEIAKEFRDCKIPAQFMTCMLRIELVRQEKQPGEEWGTEEIVPVLTTQSPQPWPNGAKKNEYQRFVQWASGHWPEIMQPLFYTFVKGDQWHLPGEAAPGPQAPVDPNAKPLDDNAIRPGFNPEKPPLDMTTAEKAALRKYKDQKAKEQAEQRKANRPQRPPPGRPGGPLEGGGGPGPGRGPGGFAPNDPQRPSGQRPPPPGAGRPPRGNPLDGVDGIGPGGLNGGMEGGMPFQPQAAPMQSVYPLPQGEFDPRVWVDPKNPQPGTGELVGWATDATAQPGKTYRYKIRYKMKNPIYGTQGVAKNPQLAQEFALIAPDSAWTSEVHIPALTSFFVATVNPGGQTARVEIYRWQSGETHPSTFTVSPGDAIGAMNKGIDFSTGYTIVDFRKDPKSGDDYVLLIDSNGQMSKRDPKQDSTSTELQKMKQQVSMTAPANGAVAGAPPGGR